MAVTDEIERIQGAKADLKTSINAKNDAQHQITDETIDEYADFVDSIQGGGGSSQVKFPTRIKFTEAEFTGVDMSWIENADTSNVKDIQNLFYMCIRGVPSVINLEGWNTSNVTIFTEAFYYSGFQEIKFSSWNTSKVTNAKNMFRNCGSLTTINVSNWAFTKSNTNMQNMFASCGSLSNDSLNSILNMCINSTGAVTKTLAYIGISSAQATTCQSLSNYQAFLDAGWTSGY